MRKKAIILMIGTCLLTLLGVGYISRDSNCTENRYIFDIGSGSTKAAGATVDICNNAIVRSHPNYASIMEYQRCMDAAGAPTMPDQCIEQGTAVIQELKDSYGTKCEGIDRCYAVATAWARQAKNADALIKRLKEENIKTVILTQSEEGKIGFKAAVAKLAEEKKNAISPEDIIVLDIGGGSFQLSSLNNAEISVLSGRHGMYNFSHEVERQFGFKPGHYMSTKEIEAVVNYTLPIFRADLSKHHWLVEKLSRKKVQVIGVGTLLNMGLRRQLNLGEVVTKEKVYDLMHKLSEGNANWMSEQYSALPKQVVPYIQLSLVLIYSIMESADFKEIHMIDVGLAEYLAFHDLNWQP